MSSPLAIGAVSAVLRNLLNDGLIQAGAAMGSTVSVSAVAPDTIDLEADDSPRLNLFLYQVTPNTGWCNRDLPSRSATTGERLTNAPLALDLHYLLTAYGRADFQAESCSATRCTFCMNARCSTARRFAGPSIQARSTSASCRRRSRHSLPPTSPIRSS